MLSTPMDESGAGMTVYRNLFWHCGVNNLFFVYPLEDGPLGRFMTATEAENRVDRWLEKDCATDIGEYIRMIRWNAAPLDHDIFCVVTAANKDATKLRMILGGCWILRSRTLR